MAWLGIIIFFIYMDTQDHAILLCLDPFYYYLLIPEERKNIWSELELNPGPLATQASALTTRPWLLGQESALMKTVNQIKTEEKTMYRKMSRWAAVWTY